MADKLFAAIDVGSFEMAMKIYEISSKKGMKEIEHVRHRLALGSDSYNSGKISFSKIDDLCDVLRKFSDIMASYHVTEYKAYGTSALRETENTLIIRDQIRNRTGIDVEVLSNSEQRFLDYKSVASRGAVFNRIIEQGTAIVDIGGGSIQISLFEKDTLVTTQSLRLGVLRLNDQVEHMRIVRDKRREQLDEMIQSQLGTFRKLYMKDREITNLIVVDDYVSRVMQSGVVPTSGDCIASSHDFMEFVSELSERGREELADKLEVPEEMVDYIEVSANIIRNIIESSGAVNIWAPGVTLCDGIAYEYAEKCKLKMIAHDFEKDILASAINISKRYMGSKKRAETISSIALELFDAMQSVHGMGTRERFLLQLASILHDCGKFINMTNVGECSYNIIMNTEMIGLSHDERQIVAYVVKFNHEPFAYYGEISSTSSLGRSEYLVIAKLTAILRIAGGLDKSHKDKMRKIKATLQDDKLVINFTGVQDIGYEKESFNKKAALFGEVFSIEPVIVQKKGE